MSSSTPNLRVSASLANQSGVRRRSRNSVLAQFEYRQNAQPARNYNGLLSLKSNYLGNLGITQHGQQLADELSRGNAPNASTKWMERPEFFSSALEIAQRFNVNQNEDNQQLVNQGFAEFMCELEKVIQHRVLSREHISTNQASEYAIYTSMAPNVMPIYTTGVGNIQNLSELTQRVRQTDQEFTDQFFTDQAYKTRWTMDFRSLMDDTIKMIMHTFSPNPNVSYFGTMIPELKDHVPDMFLGTPTSRRPKGFVYKMDKNRSFLRIIFNIMMVRFPTVNTRRNEIWNSFTVQAALDRIEPREDEETRLVSTTYISNITVEHTDISLQNMFYYIPEQERVLGIWPKTVRVSRGDESALSTLVVNYNCQMIRSVLCKIRLSPTDIEQGSKLNYMLLFDGPDNLYTRIRKMDPFRFGSRMDPYIRLFVSMTFFSETNDKILHIPWVIESLHSPLSPHDHNEGEAIPYDFSELLRMIIAILERRISGRTGEEDDGKVIYVIIKFINEHPSDYYEPQLSDFEESKEEEEEDGIERKSNRNVRPRQSRTPQQVSKVAPSMNGVSVGAPYAGTTKEKLFLNMSMVNRFQFNDALFETPQRPTTYSCFMMAILRCQMYMYTFEAGVCTDVLVTNGPRADMSCQGKFVESTMDYSKCQQCLSFIKKVDGTYYIHMFNNQKHKENGKYLSGSRNEEENQYWELAADEIWIHLERYKEREINYNDLGDYGQAFADLFNVCISIYDIEYRGNRISVISPKGKSPAELASEGEILMIHIVFDQGHIHAVNNLRNFIRSKKRKSDVRQSHYCPICDKKQTEELTASKESALAHITHCTLEKEGFQTGFRQEEDLKVQTQHVQVRSQFKKVQGKVQMVFECTQCYQPVNQLTFQSHVCTIQAKKLEQVPEQKIYVWDVEAAQLQNDFNLLQHECNCVYIRRVYTDDPVQKEGRYFPSEVEFVDALMTESEFQNSVFLAHNSGSYDIHFLLRIFERAEIDHTYTPSPTSKHKFIMVQLTERNVKFLDFIRFMPGSLRSIAESFQISVSKGDFPYKFNNGENDSYIGCIPPLDGEEDYWGLREAKSKKQVDTFTEWYNSQKMIYCSCVDNICSCDKQKWNFQDELKKYCLLDVIVLAEVVKAYRDKVLSFTTVLDEEYPDATVPWNIPRIDPFQFMTLPQITMQTLVHGFDKSKSFDGYGFRGVVSYFSADRASRCSDALLWLKRRQVLDGVFIMSRENSLREFYEFTLKQSFDGFAPTTNTVYWFLKCSFWGCPTCMREHHEADSIIPERGITAQEVSKNYLSVLNHLQAYYNVECMWEHDFNTAFMDPYYLKCTQQMSPSDAFYGGRTEVFKLYCNSEKFPDQEIHYYDVTSLYPSVYAHRRLPVGSPRYLMGYNVDTERLSPTHPNRYFGYARIKVTPSNTDRIGLLPQRDPQTQRLTFPVHPMEGCWFTEEIYLAMENGYVVEEVYELYYWESNQLSDQHLRGYVGFFLRMKQESEGWKKLGASCDEPTPEEKEEIADRLYHQNGGLARIRVDKVKLDPVMRALAKLFLNSLWGKWAQKAAKECHTTIYGTQQFFQLWNDKTVERETCQFRDISPGVYKVSYKKKNPFINPVPHGNVWLAAAVTAWARIALHTQMIRIGPEKLIYCDTDSIIFLWPKTGPVLSGIGLGKWTDEYPKNRIVKVYALAPKLYALILADDSKGTTYESFRAKGVQMTLANQEKMGFDSILPLIQRTVLEKETTHTIEVANFSIFTNSTNNQLPFGFLYSRYNKKKVRVIITKRTIEEVLECNFDEIAEINTFPPGYSLE
jgi:ribosomal protein L44E